MVEGGGLVAGDADPVGVDEAEIDAPPGRGGDHPGGPAGHGDGQGVEELPGLDRRPRRAQPGRERGGHAVGTGGDAAQPMRPVVDRVHAGHDGEQDLCRADVAGRLLPPDVLFARLQGEAVGRVPLGVAAHPDEPAG
jgi:hypothetical protein